MSSPFKVVVIRFASFQCNRMCVQILGIMCILNFTKVNTEKNFRNDILFYNKINCQRKAVRDPIGTRCAKPSQLKLYERNARISVQCGL
jgi:hypothetical protein